MLDVVELLGRLGAGDRIVPVIGAHHEVIRARGTQVVGDVEEERQVTSSATGNGIEANAYKLKPGMVSVEGESADRPNYLLVHFTSETTGGRQIHFATSRDGYLWSDLNGSKHGKDGAFPTSPRPAPARPPIRRRAATTRPDQTPTIETALVLR